MSVSRDYQPRYYVKQVKLNVDEKTRYETMCSRLRMPFSQLVRLLLEREYQGMNNDKA